MTHDAPNETPAWANSIAREWYARPSNRIPSEILITGLAALLNERFGPCVDFTERHRGLSAGADYALASLHGEKDHLAESARDVLYE